LYCVQCLVCISYHPNLKFMYVAWGASIINLGSKYMHHWQFLQKWFWANALKVPINAAAFRIHDILKRSSGLLIRIWFRIRMFSIFFFAYYFRRYITSVFKDIKSIRSHKIVEIKFFIIFLLVNGKMYPGGTRDYGSSRSGTLHCSLDATKA